MHMAILLTLLVTFAPLQGIEPPDLRGSWKPHTYQIKSGTRHSVEGLIFFSERDWAVLFFVTEQGEARKGSGEGGTYSLDQDRLVFTHLYRLAAGEAVSGLSATPLSMEIRSSEEAPREECRVELKEDSLTIFFPSGNSMVFDRSSR